MNKPSISASSARKYSPSSNSNVYLNLSNIYSKYNFFIRSGCESWCLVCAPLYGSRCEAYLALFNINSEFVLVRFHIGLLKGCPVCVFRCFNAIRLLAWQSHSSRCTVAYSHCLLSANESMGWEWNSKSWTCNVDAQNASIRRRIASRPEGISCAYWTQRFATPINGMLWNRPSFPSSLNIEYVVVMMNADLCSCMVYALRCGRERTNRLAAFGNRIKHITQCLCVHCCMLHGCYWLLLAILTHTHAWHCACTIQNNICSLYYVLRVMFTETLQK